jgi:proteasome lid subunit RPN8/RPN11
MSASPNGGSARAAPVFVKTDPELPWPEDESLFYVLGRNGLYICRNHQFFQSCVRTRTCPSELENQTTFLKPAFPLIPRTLFERVVGFFDRIGDLHNAEATALLAWDSEQQRVRIVIPSQVATVSRSWDGSQYPIGLHYTPPSFPPGWIPFGDIHSHVRLSAYASQTDVNDETHSAGLHIVVGRIHKEPPDIHVEGVVDGSRFTLLPSEVIEDYRARNRNVSKRWIERVSIEKNSGWWSGSSSVGSIPATTKRTNGSHSEAEGGGS